MLHTNLHLPRRCSPRAGGGWRRVVPSCAVEQCIVRGRACCSKLSVVLAVAWDTQLPGAAYSARTAAAQRRAATGPSRAAAGHEQRGQHGARSGGRSPPLPNRARWQCLRCVLLCAASRPRVPALAGACATTTRADPPLSRLTMLRGRGRGVEKECGHCARSAGVLISFSFSVCCVVCLDRGRKRDVHASRGEPGAAGFGTGRAGGWTALLSHARYSFCLSLSHLAYSAIVHACICSPLSPACAHMSQAFERALLLGTQPRSTCLSYWHSAALSALLHPFCTPRQKQAARAVRGRGCAYAPPGPSARPGTRGFWVGGVSEGLRGIGSVGDVVGRRRGP